MRLLLSTVIASIPICGSFAAGLEHAELNSLKSYWQIARALCSKQTDVERCYEDRALDEHADIASRKDNVLTLQLEEQAEQFVSATEDEILPKYMLLGYIKELNSFVVRVWFAMDESVDFLLNRATGEKLKLLGSPLSYNTLLFNDTGAQMLDYNYSEMAPSGVHIYDYDRAAGFKLREDLKSCLNPDSADAGKAISLADTQAQWDADDKVVVRTTFTFIKNCDVTRH